MKPPLKQKIKNCINKRRYSDEYAARSGASTSCNKNVKRLWIYKCPNCKGWHLTSCKRSNKWLITIDNLFNGDYYLSSGV